MPRGGKRAGAGKPLGTIQDSTIAKAEARAFIREKVRAALGGMVEAQIAHAKGVNYMRLRNADGSFARATDEKQIDAAIASGATWFEIFTEAPHTQAFVALTDRAFDKPTEHQETEIKGDLTLRWEG